jgi:hypothetical protein
MPPNAPASSVADAIAPAAPDDSANSRWISVSAKA